MPAVADRMRRPGRRLLRWVAPAALVLLGAVAGATTVLAHALPVASNPAPGAILAQPPSSVSMTFNEAPEPALSYIDVLDTTGRHHETGHAAASPSDPRTLTVAVTGLGKGVYTVAWRTVAADDGHRITGSYAFGVDVLPPAPVAAQEQPATSALTPLGVTARALYYVAVVLLLGGIAVALLAGPAVWGRLRRPLLGASVAAVAGAAGITAAQLTAAGGGWGQLLGTSLTGSLLTRLLPALLAVPALLLAITASSALARRLMAAAGALTALSALGDAAATHASTESLAALSVALQWVHLLAAGAWIGGLGALVAVLGTVPREQRARLLERAAAAAAACLVLVAGTGVLRSIGPLGSWAALVTTLYGALILAKLGLIGVLAALGALNRLNARRPGGLEAGFRRVSSVQVVAGVLALVLASALVNVAPPAAVTAVAQSGPAPLTTTGTDGNTFHVRLEVSPGTPGNNHFTVTLTGFSGGEPVSDAAVSLGFLYQGPGGIGESALDLDAVGDGTYAADGVNLSLAGPWSITAQVGTSTWIYDVPMQITTRAAPASP